MLLPALARTVEVISLSAVIGGLHPHPRSREPKSGAMKPQAQRKGLSGGTAGMYYPNRPGIDQKK
jgi:hypothetical protein